MRKTKEKSNNKTKWQRRLAKGYARINQSK